MLHASSQGLSTLTAQLAQEGEGHAKGATGSCTLLRLQAALLRCCDPEAGLCQICLCACVHEHSFCTHLLSSSASLLRRLICKL